MAKFLIQSILISLVAFGVVSFQSAEANQYRTGVYINGAELTHAELIELEKVVGGRVPPGDYRVDERGCWIELRSKQIGCIGRPPSTGDTPSMWGDRDGPITRYDLLK